MTYLDHPSLSTANTMIEEIMSHDVALPALIAVAICVLSGACFAVFWKKPVSISTPKDVQFQETATVIQTSPSSKSPITTTPLKKSKEEPELAEEKDMATSTPPKSRPPATPFASPSPNKNGSAMTPGGRRSARLAKVGTTMDHEGNRRSCRVSSARKQLRM
eukprot:CAMPEP_0194244498 /NCGR_PEP_ID=MMETSP0158-20130606/11431_1 /TAXON_ID=33649 /ORGANISM="Thalassionema nitzschioides, Strain L26-B" /LENGTH=161 /DNA_ID=CAMNT_0038980007 /DNA_START=48 /DNA_END=533 /DNA_ORIENTATION=-